MSTELSIRPWETGQKWASLICILYVTYRNLGFLPNVKNSPTVWIVNFTILLKQLYPLILYSYFLIFSNKAVIFQIIYFTSVDLETDYYNYDSKPVFCCPAPSWVIGAVPLCDVPFC